MSRYEEEILGERPGDWTDDYQCLTNDALKRQAIRNQKIGVVRDEIGRCERRLVYLRQDLARLNREGEAQLPLDDQPTFAPEWPAQRKAVDRGQ